MSRLETTQTHEIVPIKDSSYSERTQHPANLMDHGHYPVLAVCRECSGRIRLLHFYDSWQHVAVES
jgi:hypothetical protein